MSKQVSLRVSGFQVNVAGNADLKGAVIASTDKAANSNVIVHHADGSVTVAPLNSLTTQTLTTSNLENKADYKASSMSIGAGVGLNKQPDGSYKNSPTASAGSASDSGNGSSVTVSGISGGTVNVTGQDKLTTLASLNREVKAKQTTNAQGNITNTAVDSNGNNLAATLTPIFDKEQVQRELAAQVQITQAFSQVAPKAVGDYASNQVKKYTDEGNPAEAAKWDEGGIYRIALHAALGGLLTGDLSGAAAAGSIASAAPLLNDLQKSVTEQLTKAGASTQTASTISQALAELTSLGIGSAIGGAAGAGTALVVDTNNRQLHQVEIDRIKQLAKGDNAKEAKLTAAACALVRCADGVPTDDPAYAYLKGMQNLGATYKNELDLLAAQTGRDGRTYGQLYQYTIGMDFQDYLNQTKQGTRIVGAVQAIGGGVGIVGGAGMCTTGIGCAGGAVVATVSADYGAAGLNQAITGQTQVTQGEQVLQSLGLSPQTAAYTYAAIGLLTPAAAESLIQAANKGTNFAVNGLESTILKLQANDAGKITGFSNASDVNALMNNYNLAPAWKSGTVVADTLIAPGTKVQMVVSQSVYEEIKLGNVQFGGWATFDKVASQSYARNELAITNEFKKDVSYVIEVEITKPVQAQVGVVGKQAGAAGGGNQINFVIDPADRASIFKYIQGSGKALQ